MKKFILYFSAIWVFIFLNALAIVPTYAAVTCQDSGQSCGNGTGTCCALSSNGKPLACTPVGRGSASVCEEQTVGTQPGRGTCANAGTACAANIPCCSVDTNTKQPLTCDSTNKCVVASAAKGTCIAQGKSCTFTDNCCSSGTTNLSCVNASGNVVGYSETGTCATPANTNAGANIIPPPPPCATAITTGGCTSVNTAFGIWSTDPPAFVKSLFGILLSISGAIAVLIIMFAGYKMMMSQGDPEKIAGAKEQMTAAIIGLLFLIFSLVILQVIGVDILHLPGFK